VLPSTTTSIDAFLYAHGLAQQHETPAWTALTGGVSSEILRVDLPGRSFCVKRALPKLKVAADWEAPVSRNMYEWQWMKFAASHLPRAVPEPLAHDSEAGLFAMSFLPPEQYPVWKTQLLEGHVDPSAAASVGSALGLLHQVSARRPDLAVQFDSQDNFHALRIEPYLLACAERHADLSERLRDLARRTATLQLALVHGDVSPKNILIGPEGPVFLDAECASYGDPAFDVAFCLNHLFLKMLVRSDKTGALLESFSQLVECYFKQVSFEPRAVLETRIAELLPALMLARVDGKSPVEYLSARPQDQEVVRRVARSLLQSRETRLSAIADAWSRR